jgi:hypothetical protein
MTWKHLDVLFLESQRIKNEIVKRGWGLLKMPLILFPYLKISGPLLRLHG